jgi:hypothetical protein
MNQHQTPCPYCGQIISFQLTLAEQAEFDGNLERKAAALCKCPEANFHRGMRATEQAINEIIGEGGRKYFDRAISDETVDAVREICAQILRENLCCVTITVPCGDVLKLVRNGNAVKIRRCTKRQMEM